MCWLPIEQPLLLPGDSTCSSANRPSHCSAAQVLASRLRRIGDQLEKSWTAKGDNDGGYSWGEMGSVALVTGQSSLLKRFLGAAIRFTVLVLFVTRRHL